MKFENTQTWGFEHAIRGMRNPKNSHLLIDSIFGLQNAHFNDKHKEVSKRWVAMYHKNLVIESREWYEQLNAYAADLKQNGVLRVSDDGNYMDIAYIGPKDMRLAQTLIRGGAEHRKFLRQIFVSVDITAPLYWWKEFDTYKIGTTANSTSTMHKLADTPITLDCFEIDDYEPLISITLGDEIIETPIFSSTDEFIAFLEDLRQRYNSILDLLKTEDLSEEERKKYTQYAKQIWKELIRWLPESWLQTRTVTMSYENIYNMRHQRKGHKLNEWSGLADNQLENFIKWTDTLPYANAFFLN